MNGILDLKIYIKFMLSILKKNIEKTTLKVNKYISNNYFFVWMENSISYLKKNVKLWTIKIKINYGAVRGRPGFNPRSSHTKDSKNGTWCLLV